LAYYKWVLLPRLNTPDVELLVTVDPPPPVFNHPHDDQPWLWRAWFKVTRVLYLMVIFTPCAALSAIMSVSDNPDWRERFLTVLVKTLENAGCSFQKFGQWLSMRPDMFAPDIISALSKLRNDVPPHSFEHTRAMIFESFGVELEELFEEFDMEPVASGTVAQVHKGRLRPEHAVQTAHGKTILDVAVKVRHPSVLDEIWVDVELIFKFMDKFPLLTIPFSQEEFAGILQKQVDFHWEAHHLTRFAKNFRHEVTQGKLSFPDVLPNLLSESVLVESWASGTTVSSILSEVGFGFQQIASQVENEIDKFGDAVRKKKKELAKTVFDMNMKMFLRDNLVHGDLHAGNVLYDEEGNCCTVLDAGLTASLGPDVTRSFGHFLRALCTGDTQLLVDKLVEFDNSGNVDEPALRRDMQRVVDRWVSSSGTAKAPDGGMISLGDLLGDLLFSLQRNHVVLRGDIAACIMTMSVSEGLIRSLDPDFDVVRNALPYFVRFNGWTNQEAVLTSKPAPAQAT